jgi:tRNA pseudouridine55 synthase
MNGWINLNKPVGMTSAQAVGAVKRMLPRGTKIGHAGTLDPLADGVLPLALGEATKLISLLHMDDKTYRFSILWGHETTTDDREGAPTRISDKRPSQTEIEAAMPAFRGTISQIPPAFSALKINGQRAYDLARAGETVELAARAIQIYELTLESHSETETVLVCTCGTGTYVRSLARDIARAVGSAGHVGLLTRTRVGPFGLDTAFLLDNARQTMDKDGLLRAILPVDFGLDDILAVSVGTHEETRLRHGQDAIVTERLFADPILIRGPNGIVGIGIQNDRTLKTKRLLNL